jgi:hypothetical protein
MHQGVLVPLLFVILPSPLQFCYMHICTDVPFMQNLVFFLLPKYPYPGILLQPLWIFSYLSYHEVSRLCYSFAASPGVFYPYTGQLTVAHPTSILPHIHCVFFNDVGCFDEAPLPHHLQQTLCLPCHPSITLALVSLLQIPFSSALFNKTLVVLFVDKPFSSNIFSSSFHNFHVFVLSWMILLCLVYSCSSLLTQYGRLSVSLNTTDCLSPRFSCWRWSPRQPFTSLITVSRNFLWLLLVLF